MNLPRRNLKFVVKSFIRHDFRASITVFFVALPLCMGIALASGAPAYSGLIAGMIGGIVVSAISGSKLSVSGPAAGLTAISAAAIMDSGSPGMFFIAVSLAGIFQILFGIFKLAGFTHFIPSSVIKGMLAAIGIILMSKQIPILFGYDQPDFWTKELFNVFTLSNTYSQMGSIVEHTSAGITAVSIICFATLFIWRKKLHSKIAFIPASMVAVVTGAVSVYLIGDALGMYNFKATHFITLPENIFSGLKKPELALLPGDFMIWKTAMVIAIVASLETLLSIEAIDKLDSGSRPTPLNRELVAQGTGNFLSGMLSGLPITAVIVRSSANAEAGAKSWLSAFMHGVWLILVLLFFIPAINKVPYCALAVILTRTGYQLAKPKMIGQVYKQGREQFLPFIVTVAAILFTDLLLGVTIGILYSIYFLVKHTYRAGYSLTITDIGHLKKYDIKLALNVSFMNKKRILDMLEQIPKYSIVEIDAMQSIYIDHDILEIFQDYRQKAHQRHIELTLKKIPEVQTIGLHG